MNITFITEKEPYNALGTPFKNSLKALLHSEAINLTTYEIAQDDLHHCIGCFNCWVKTPGVCILKDMGNTIVTSIINSDLVIWLTPLTYGGYSAALKKVVDRQLPLLLPFFKLINGEMHHSKRYKKYPVVIYIGYSETLTQKEVELFNKLALANQTNFHAKNLHTYTYKNLAEGDETLASLTHTLKTMKGVALHD